MRRRQRQDSGTPLTGDLTYRARIQRFHGKSGKEAIDLKAVIAGNPEKPGKIHEYRTYVMHPGTLDGYLQLVESKLQPLRQDRFGRLLGFWYSEFGTLNQVHHLWEFETLDHRQEQRRLLAHQKSWREEFLEKVLPAIQTQQINFLRPAITVNVPTVVSAFYEMRRYQAVVGKSAQLLQEVLRRPKSSECTLAGVWTSESPDPNEVLELSAYPDFQSRLEQGLQQPAQCKWAGTVQGLMLGMVSTMLLPAEISPLR